MAIRPVCAALLLAGIAATAGGCTTTSHSSPPLAPVTRSRATSTPSNDRPAPHAAGLGAHRTMVATAVWVRLPEGERLRVHPTGFGRTVADRHPARALRQSLRLARPTPIQLTKPIAESLRNQLRCHAAFAPDKPAWNLEAWRSDVGYLSTVLHACNP